MTQPDETAPLVFDCSVDQSVGAMVEWSRWSPHSRRIRRASLVVFVLSMTFVMTVFLWAGQDERDPLAFALAAFVAALFGVAYWFSYDYSLRRRARRLVREARGGLEPVTCEVTLAGDHLRSKASGVESSYDWRSCVELHDRPDGIYFIFRAGPVFVPSAAFADAASRRQFVDNARRAMQGAA